MKRNKKAFTLLETVLAMGVSALILMTLTTAFKAAKINWKENNERSALVQKARAGMTRMIEELRHADSLINVGSVLEFTTTNLLDDDAGSTETIKFERLGGAVRRTVNGGTFRYFLGDIFSNSLEVITVTFFNTTAMKVNQVTGDLEPLALLDPLSLAVAVEVEFTLRDKNGDTINFKSMAKLRNI